MNFSNSDLFSVEKKNIIITGGSRGIGKILTKELSFRNANVTVIDITNPNINNINFLKCDLNKTKSINKIISNYHKKYKCADVLINCAAITIPRNATSYTISDWNKTISVNLTGIFFICKEIGKKMIQKKVKGSIINFTSIGAEQGFENNPAYAASKGGLKQLSKALATEWGKDGIRVNNIVPGYTNTPMNRKSFRNIKKKKQRSRNSILNRWAEPSEMIGATIFLSSNASSFITGSDIVVDGGWLAKGLK